MKVSLVTLILAAFCLAQCCAQNLTDKNVVEVGFVFLGSTAFRNLGRRYIQPLKDLTRAAQKKFPREYTLSHTVGYLTVSHLVSGVLDLICNTLIPKNVSVIVFLDELMQFGENAKITQYFYHLNSFTGIPILAWNPQNSGILVNKNLNDYRLLQMAPSLESQVEAMMAILKRYGWKKFAVVTSTVSGHKNFASLCRQYLADQKNKAAKFELVSTVVVSSTTNGSEASIREELSAIDPDVRIFLFYCAKEEAKMILEGAKSLGLCSTNYLWIATQSVVAIKTDLTEFTSYPIGMLAVYFSVDTVDMDNNAILVQMNYALQIITAALKTQVDTEKRKKITRNWRSNSSCEKDVNYKWKEGDDLYRYLKGVSTQVVMSGSDVKYKLEFSDEGYLRHPHLTIINLNRNRHWVDVGEFVQEKLKINDITWPGESTTPPTGQPNKFHLKVVTLEESPFVVAGNEYDRVSGKCPSNKAIPCRWASQITSTSNETTSDNRTEIWCCTGYCIDLLNQLAHDMGFDYELYRVRDGKWGALSCVNNSGTLKSMELCEKQDQVWNGLVKDLVDSTADLCITSLKINSEREEALDMSLPFLETGISIAVAIRRGALSPTAFLEPFDTNTWLLVLMASIQLSALAMFIFEWLSPQSYDMNKYPRPGHKFSLFRVFWLVWATLFSASVNTDVPRSHTSRFMALVWAAFSLVFYAVYTANLAAFMITRVEFHDITGINDGRLVNPYSGTERFRFGTITSGNTFVTLKKNYYEVFKNMEPYNTDTVLEGVSRLKTGQLDAFIYDAVVLDYLAGKDNNCQLLNNGKWFAKSGYAVGLKKGSKLTDKVNFHLLQYQQNGFLERLQNFWFTGVCSADSINKKGDSMPLGINNFMSAFILLSGGTVLCLLILCFEYFYCRYIRPKLTKSKWAGWCSLLSLSMAKSLSFSEAVIHLHKRNKENQRRNVTLRSKREETLEKMLFEANSELIKLSEPMIKREEDNGDRYDGRQSKKRRAFNNLYVPIKPNENCQIEKESVL